MTFTGYRLLTVVVDGALVTCVIDNPPINLMTGELISELDRFADELIGDGGAVAVVLKSANPDFFIPHAQFSRIHQLRTPALPASRDEAGLNDLQQVCEKFRRMDKIIIAQISGRTGGGGAELAMACDIRFGALGKAVFNNPGVPLGIMPGGGGTQYMPRLIGRARALEVILGGIDLDAATAEEWGYLNRALPEDELDAFVESYARRIALCPPLAVRQTKKAIEATSLPLEIGLAEENFIFQELMATDDAAERMRMFVEMGGETPEGEGRLAELCGDILEHTSDPQRSG